jgi:hypothetical protein
VFAEPTINDFLALVDWHIAKAQDRAARAVNEVRAKASAAGAFQSGGTIMQSIERARIEFDAGVNTVLGELKRVARSTKLNRDDLRQHAVQRLTQFGLAVKAISQAEQFRNMSPDISRYIDEQFAAFDQHLQFALRQFDVGFLDPAEPEVPPVANSITVGTMIGSSIAQASPGTKQTTEFTLNIEAATTALGRFEAAIATAALPATTVDELMADVHTIQAQLAKPKPSRLIVQEAGKSLRHVIEGVAGGMLTPTVATAAAALWSALGLG